MPKVAVREIRRLNEERLVLGLLPTPWMFAYMPLVLITALVRFPRNLGEAVPVFATLAGTLFLMVTIHRVSRARIIPHWIKWHNAGRGALLGRDVHPLPHRYQEMDVYTEQYVQQRFLEDRKRTQMWKRERQQVRTEEQRRLQTDRKTFERGEKQRAQRAKVQNRPGRGRAA